MGRGLGLPQLPPQFQVPENLCKRKTLPVSPACSHLSITQFPVLQTWEGYSGALESLKRDLNCSCGDSPAFPCRSPRLSIFYSLVPRTLITSGTG